MIGPHKRDGPSTRQTGCWGCTVERASEYDLEPELDVTRWIDARGLAEGAGRQASIGILQVHIVEQIEELSSKLNACGLILPEPGNPGVLDDVEVGVNVSRTDKRIAAEVSFLTQARHREIRPREDTIQELLFRPLLESAERGDVGIVSVEPVGVVVAAAVPNDSSTCIGNRDKGIVTHDVVRAALLQDDHSASLPPARQPT